jgi:small conductance mechanosensitive channel
MELDITAIEDVTKGLIAYAWIVIPSLILAGIYYFVGIYIIRFLTKTISNLFLKYEIEASLALFLSSLIRVVLYVVLVLAVASTLGFPITSFIAILGAAGLAVGLALQGSLSNFAGGVLILIFKPFKVGETIEAQGTLGSVEKIDILYTTVRNFDNRVVIIPNGGLANSSITNLSTKPTRRTELKLGVAYGTDLKKTRNVILETLQKDERILADPAPVVYFTEFGDSSLNLTVRIWANVADLWPVYWDNMEAVKEAFEANDIEVPFPQRDVNHYFPEGKPELFLSQKNGN